MTAFLKGHKSFNKPDESSICHSHRESGNPLDPDAEFMFLPAWTGNINPINSTLSFEGNCFELIEMEMSYKDDESTVELIVKTEKPRNHTCSDFFIFGNTEMMHVEDFFFRGTHKLNFKLPSPIAEENLASIGLETFLLCEDMRDEILSVFTTIKAFVGGLGLHGKIPLF